MTKSPRKNEPDVGIELGAACMQSGYATDRATARGWVGRYPWLILDSLPRVYTLFSAILINWVFLLGYGLDGR